MDKKIFLVGGRATGKTTIGKLLAKRLQMDFVDMDKLIEKRSGQTINEIVERHGWKNFRQQEHKLLAELHSENDLIVATGGGAVLHQDIWPQIKKKSLVVWLKADCDTIRTRMVNDIKSKSQRPSLTGDDIVAETQKILTEREPLYLKSSHLQISTEQPIDIILLAVEKEYLKAQDSDIAFNQQQH